MTGQTMCRSVFKDGEPLDTEKYTQVWIDLIDQLERARALTHSVDT